MTLASIAEEIGRKLRKAREKRGMTQEQLASLLGLESKVSVHGYEKGTTPISIEYLVKLPQILNVGLADLLPDNLLTAQDRKKLRDPDLLEIIDRWPELGEWGRGHVRSALEVALRVEEKNRPVS